METESLSQMVYSHRFEVGPGKPDVKTNNNCIAMQGDGGPGRVN